jgi:hypothetical protein
VGPGITEATAEIRLDHARWLENAGRGFVKLQEQQLKKLRECEERQALIKEVC